MCGSVGQSGRQVFSEMLIVFGVDLIQCVSVRFFTTKIKPVLHHQRPHHNYGYQRYIMQCFLFVINVG